MTSAEPCMSAPDADLSSGLRYGSSVVKMNTVMDSISDSMSGPRPGIFSIVFSIFFTTVKM